MPIHDTAFESTLSEAKKTIYATLDQESKKQLFQTLDAHIQSLVSPTHGGYWALAPQVQKLLQNLPGQGEEQKVLCFKALMLELIDYQLKNNIFFIQSEKLHNQAQKRYGLLIRKHLKYEISHYTHTRDSLLKDFALCTGKLISTGLTLYNITKFPKSYLLRNYKHLAYFLSINAFGTMLEGHIDDRCYQLFNIKGWKEGYGLTSEIMRICPQIRGVFGRSWYYDPIVFNKISPELKFTSTFQLENGAKLLTAKATQSDIDFATSRSSVRQHLYNEGLYTPQGYILMWDRKNIMRWAQTLDQI